MPEDLEAEQNYLIHSELLADLPGGASLISQYGQAPSFHDAIVQEIRLSTSGKSWVQFWLPGFDPAGFVVNFEIESIIDLKFDFFQNNILFELLLRRPVVRPDRTSYLNPKPADSDLELEFVPSWGLSGFLVARGVSVRWSRDGKAQPATKACLEN